jgi:hypothetical protein
MGRAILRIDLQFLHELLELPKDCSILWANFEYKNNTIEMLLESKKLPEVAEAEPYPTALAHCSVEHYPENRAFTRRSVRIEAVLPEAKQP